MSNELAIEAVFQNIVAKTLKAEGLFSDHPNDRGGATKYGITLGTFCAVRGKDKTVADLQAMTVDDAVDIYREYYWKRPYIWLFWRWPGLALAVFDFGVHSGPSRAIQHLQATALLQDTGKLDAKTHVEIMRHVNNMGVRYFTNQYVMARGEFLMKLVRDNHGQNAFALGWYRRVMKQLDFGYV
jgi:lysozyme family protein